MEQVVEKVREFNHQSLELSQHRLRGLDAFAAPLTTKPSTTPEILVVSVPDLREPSEAEDENAQPEETSSQVSVATSPGPSQTDAAESSTPSPKQVAQSTEPATKSSPSPEAPVVASAANAPGEIAESLPSAADAIESVHISVAHQAEPLESPLMVSLAQPSQKSATQKPAAAARARRHASLLAPHFPRGTSASPSSNDSASTLRATASEISQVSVENSGAPLVAEISPRPGSPSGNPRTLAIAKRLRESIAIRQARNLLFVVANSLRDDHQLATRNIVTDLAALDGNLTQLVVLGTVPTRTPSSPSESAVPVEWLSLPLADPGTGQKMLEERFEVVVPTGNCRAWLISMDQQNAVGYLSAACDATIMLVDLNETQVDACRLAVAQLREHGARLLGTVALNDPRSL